MYAITLFQKNPGLEAAMAMTKYAFRTQIGHRRMSLMSQQPTSARNEKGPRSEAALLYNDD
jgi:hypothetical protein